MKKPKFNYKTYKHNQFRQFSDKELLDVLTNYELNLKLVARITNGIDYIEFYSRDRDLSKHKQLILEYIKNNYNNPKFQRTFKRFNDVYYRPLIKLICSDEWLNPNNLTYDVWIEQNL